MFILKEREEILRFFFFPEIHIRACLDWRNEARLTSLRAAGLCVRVSMCVSGLLSLSIRGSHEEQIRVSNRKPLSPWPIVIVF